jgi:hypothetical protein
VVSGTGLILSIALKNELEMSMLPILSLFWPLYFLVTPILAILIKIFY